MSTRFEDGPPGYSNLYGEGDDGGRRARVPVRHNERLSDRLGLTHGLTHTRSLAGLGVGATAFGVMAVGAVAIGALAISRLAIKRMALQHGHIQSLTIDELRVRRLRIDRRDEPEARPRFVGARRA